MNLVFALSYSSKWEILNAVKTACLNKKLKEVLLSVGMKILMKAFICSKHLCTSGYPDPELIKYEPVENIE